MKYLLYLTVFCLLACSSNDETVSLSDLYPGSFNLEYPENEKAFLEAMKGKKIEKVSKKEDDKEKSGNQKALLGDATVEQTSKASNQEVSQPQNNQQENTESESEDTSSDSQEDKTKKSFFIAN
mgnify:CR=1 FL=1